MLNKLGWLLFGFCISARSLSAAAPVVDFADAIGRLEALRVETASVAVHNLKLSSGHLDLLLTSGQASLVRAGDRAIGVFFQGNGSLEYRSEDPVEFPLTSYNVRKTTSLSPERTAKAVIIRDGFTDVLWLAAGANLPELTGSNGGPSLDGAFQKHREKFRYARIRPPNHRLALQWVNQSVAPIVVAELEGGKQDLEYVFDGLEEHSESLSVLRPSESSDPEVKKNLYATVLSEQSIGHDRRDPITPNFVLTDVQLELVASDAKNAAITVTETVVPLTEKQRLFRFRLYNTIYDSVGSGALQPRQFHVRGVTDEAGRALSFDHHRGSLLVGLAQPAEPDQPVRVRFQIDGDFLIRPSGDNYWLLGIEPWFPQPDLGGQFFTFHATVKVPKPFVPFASGTTIARRTDGNLNILETQIDKPVAGPVVLAGKYDFEEETRNGVTIRVATYAAKNARAIKQLTNLAASVIEYYEAFLGPFPFPELSILEINDWGFGQAPPGVMFITKEAFNPLMGETNQLFSEGVNERFAHEIAHQYWGHVVKMPSLEEQWLEESFAEYSAALFLRQFKGKSAYDSLVSHWKGRASYATDKAPIPLANLISTSGDSTIYFAIRTGLVYDKGAYLLYALHKELGDDTFLTFLKSYQKSFRWKFGSTKKVEGLLEFLTKKDYRPFFEANYWGTGMPK